MKREKNVRNEEWWSKRRLKKVKRSRENPLQIKYSKSRKLFRHSLVECQHLHPLFSKFIGFLSLIHPSL